MAYLDETGLSHLWGKITNKFLAKSNVANNLTTTSEGYALDARQGVALMNAISGSNMRLVPEILLNVSNGEVFTKNFTINHDCILYIDVDLTSSNSISSDEIYIKIAGTSHTIYRKPDNTQLSPARSVRCMNYQAFIPAGTTVELSRASSGSCDTGILATVLYIE